MRQPLWNELKRTTFESLDISPTCLQGRLCWSCCNCYAAMQAQYFVESLDECIYLFNRNYRIYMFFPVLQLFVLIALYLQWKATIFTASFWTIFVLVFAARRNWQCWGTQRGEIWPPHIQHRAYLERTQQWSYCASQEQVARDRHTAGCLTWWIRHVLRRSESEHSSLLYRCFGKMEKIRCITLHLGHHFGSFGITIHWRSCHC